MGHFQKWLTPIEHKKDKFQLDYCKSIFGYADNQNHYKSRISFFDAVCLKDTNFYKRKYRFGEPKPSSLSDYIVQTSNNIKSYEDDDFRIRGWKQYWLHDAISKEESGDEPSFSAMSKGNQFRGKIHFENLSKDELGLLLWCLKLKKGCKQNIGKGKPYGFGAMKLMELNLEVVDYNQLYKEFSFAPFKKEKDKVDDYIEYYKDYMKKHYDIQIEDEKSIKAFMTMKSFVPRDIRYMTLDEYQNRNRESLFEVEKVEEGKMFKEYIKKNRRNKK